MNIVSSSHGEILTIVNSIVQSVHLYYVSIPSAWCLERIWWKNFLDMARLCTVYHKAPNPHRHGRRGLGDLQSPLQRTTEHKMGGGWVGLGSSLFGELLSAAAGILMPRSPGLGGFILRFPLTWFCIWSQRPQRMMLFTCLCHYPSHSEIRSMLIINCDQKIWIGKLPEFCKLLPAILKNYCIFSHPIPSFLGCSLSSPSIVHTLVDARCHQ